MLEAAESLDEQLVLRQSANGSNMYADGMRALSKRCDEHGFVQALIERATAGDCAAPCHLLEWMAAIR